MQGWEFAYSLIAHSLIAHSLIAHSLIRSNRSGQMSECERFAQVAQDKWANVSDSLRSLRTKERMSESLGFFEQIAHFLFLSQKMSD